MVLSKQDVIHVVTRRGFPGDIARHFVGTVKECADGVARVEGFPFIHDSTLGTFVRRKGERTRLVSLSDAGLIITVLPDDVQPDCVRYEDVGGRLILTDGKKLEMDLSEYLTGA